MQLLMAAMMLWPKRSRSSRPRLAQNPFFPLHIPPKKPVKHDKNTKKPGSARPAWINAKKLAAGVFVLGVGIQPVSAAVRCEVYVDGSPGTTVKRPTCQEAAEIRWGTSVGVECPDFYQGQQEYRDPQTKFTLWVNAGMEHCNYAGYGGLYHYFFDCVNGSIEYPEGSGKCVPIVNTYNLNKPKLQGCGVGNPIYPLTGVKKEFVDTGVALGGLKLALIYDTTAKMAAAQADTRMGLSALPSFGELWTSSFHRTLSVLNTPGYPKSALLARGDGKVLNFSGDGTGVFTTNADGTTLSEITGGYRVTDPASGDQEQYNSFGALVRLSRGSGVVLDFAYNGAYHGANLIEVKASDGRSVKFAYTNNLITEITDPGGHLIKPVYDAKLNLVSLTWQDGKKAQYLYGNTNFAWALTGKTDENGSRFATFAYDSAGRAISSEHAGGVEKHSLSYDIGSNPKMKVTDNLEGGVLYRTHSWALPGGTTVTLPNGELSSLGAASIGGASALTSQSQPAGSGCVASTSAAAYDSEGNITSQDDFNGTRSCFAYSRNVPIVTVEGLEKTASCPTVLTANAVLPAGSRKTSTTLHPTLSIPVKTAQPLSITTNIYNGRPDPFNGNAALSCAPSAVKTVVCKQVVQATTDANGAQGVAAPLDPAVAAQTTSWTYDAMGRVLTSKDARGNTTKYAYYAETALSGTVPNAVGYTQGDLKSITNAANQVTQFTQYDAAGRLTKSIDPKGMVTELSYAPRGWLLSAKTTTSEGLVRTTRYEYDAVGQLLKTTQPDGTTLGQAYDAAHRLVKVTDARGNSVNYTLDKMGNRVVEQLKNSAGTLQRSIGRRFDALNRLEQVQGAAQ
jgi:YD repeat-containing protein